VIVYYYDDVKNNIPERAIFLIRRLQILIEDSIECGDNFMSEFRKHELLEAVNDLADILNRKAG